VAIVQQMILAHHDKPFQNTWTSFFGASAFQYTVATLNSWFNSPGSVTKSWTVPSGVNSIHAVAIANGGASENTSSSNACWGGEGGAIAYGLNIPVTPGETLTIVAPPTMVGGNSRNSNGGNWGQGFSWREWSYEGGIKRGSTWLIRAGETHYGQDNMQNSSNRTGTLYSQGAISGTALTGGGRGGWCNESNEYAGQSNGSGPTPGCDAAGWSSNSPQYTNHAINACTGGVTAQCADGSGVSGTPPTELNVSFSNDTFVNCSDQGTGNGYKARHAYSGSNFYYTHNHPNTFGKNHISQDDLNTQIVNSSSVYSGFGWGSGGHHCGFACNYKGILRYSGGPGLVRIGY